MWSKRGNLDKAFEAVYSALQDPMSSQDVDAHVGACIVGACIHNRNPERALAVFEEMKEWRDFSGPDANTYGALISGLPTFGLTRKAVEIANEACSALRLAARSQDRGQLSSSAVLRLFKALKREGLFNELGVPLQEKLRSAGFKIDSACGV